jgi:2-polyprenyl-3-methyl-5-hydroxy-6-metoxy-1,4-benzoquinol methylase
VNAASGAHPAGGLEHVACPLCGASDDELRFEKDGFRVVSCRACSLVYVNPRLSMEALAGLYNDQVISYAHYYVKTAREDARSFAKRLDLIERHLSPATDRPLRLLELGCGPGTFMRVAKDRGWTVRGVDLNAESVGHCHRAGLDVVCGTFPDAAFAGQRYDVAVMSDFIEHVTDPLAVLSAVREHLEPGGMVFITTPDVGSPLARAAGGRWPHLKPVEHLTYFSRGTIRALLARAGFEVVVLRSMGRVRNLGLALERLEHFSWRLSRVGRALVPRAVAERVHVPLNPGDEMAVLARRGD